MSLSVKRVFAQRWADMSDDDSLGELPSAAAIKAQFAANSDPTAASSTPIEPAAPTQSPLIADTIILTPPAHETPNMPPPTPTKPPVATLAAVDPSVASTATAASVLSITVIKPASSSTVSVVFQSKPKPGFKSWTDLARPGPTAASASPFTTEAVDPVRRVLSFGDSDDDNSRMDILPAPVTAAAAAAVPTVFDPELDNSRDGLPLLLRQSTMVSGLGRLAEDDTDSMDASMETSRDRGVKRKQAEAEAPTPSNTPEKEAAPSKQLVTAWAAGKAAALFGKTRSATAAVQVTEAAAVVVEAKEEGATKKQKVSDTQAVLTKAATTRTGAFCPAPLPVSIIRPVSVSGRVTRSTWKRINDAAAQMPPPSPALSAINSVSPAQRKQRLVVVKRRDLPTAAPSTVSSSTAVPLTVAAPGTDAASPSRAVTASPDSSASSTSSPTPAPPPSPRTLARRLEQRQKQIQLGKRTVGYERYRTMVHKRDRVIGLHPRTPNAKKPCSKRSWDGQVRKWRRELHRWDEGKNGEKDEMTGSEAEGDVDEADGEVEEGEVASEVSSEWSMRDEGETSEMGSELDSEVSNKRGEEAETREMHQPVQDGLSVA